MKPGWIAAWKNEPTIDRMSRCISMLVVHGLLPDGERIKVSKRFLKWQERRLKRAAKSHEI